MRPFKEYIITDGDTSQASIASAAIDIAQSFGFSIHAIWTGTTAGTIQVQVSNDGSNFTSVSGATITPAGGASSGVYNFPDCFYQYARVVYTKTSGTGLLNVIASSKGV